jgi:hypothetical protein
LSLNPTTGAITGTPTALGTFSFVARVVDSTGGAQKSATVSCSITIVPARCSQTTMTFSGSSSTKGSPGNVRSFSIDGVQVRVSAFSRSVGATWSPAYLGLYPEGFGVTDSAEGDGSYGRHRVDNIGANNYVLFEFASPVIVDQAYLASVVSDSDASVWVGSFTDPYNNHLTLSDALLNGFALSEDNNAASGSDRWANLNAGSVKGNAFVVAASKSDVTPDDQFKVRKLYVCK